MKKHNDGYALPFVLVVMLVLAIVATSVMSAALQNLQTQQRTIERMQDKYAAQGAIEMLVAQLREEFAPVEYEGKTETEEIKKTVKASFDKMIQDFCNTYNGIPNTSQTAEVSSGTSAGEVVISDNYCYVFTLESISNSVCITCELELSVQFEYKGTENSADSSQSQGTITINPVSIKYNSYEVSNFESTDDVFVTMPTETTTGGVA